MIVEMEMVSSTYRITISRQRFHVLAKHYYESTKRGSKKRIDLSVYLRRINSYIISVKVSSETLFPPIAGDIIITFKVKGPHHQAWKAKEQICDEIYNLMLRAYLPPIT